MSSHCRGVLWPEHDGELAAFMQRLTTTRVRRWHLHRKTVGYWRLYQGTHQSFPMTDWLVEWPPQWWLFQVNRQQSKARVGIVANGGATWSSLGTRDLASNDCAGEESRPGIDVSHSRPPEKTELVVVSR